MRSTPPTTQRRKKLPAPEKAAKKTVMIGLLGVSLDAIKAPERWGRWRPSVALFQHEDLFIDRMELLFQPRYESMAERIAQDITLVSPQSLVRLHPIKMKNPWDFEMVYGELHDFCRAYDFKPDEEEYLVHITTGTHVHQICLFLLTESRHLPARLAQSSPPGSKHRGEPGKIRIIDLDLSRYDRIASRFHQDTNEGLSFLKFGVKTRNVAFNRLIERIERVALLSNAPILLTGPTGAGKTRLAKRIFDLKESRHQIDGAFVDVNCATLKGEHAMAALFGHTRGAFTGALKAREGLLRAAHKGTLFLDEIGELGLDEQAMLLQAIEQKTFLPVGADQKASSDFLLIAGTNRDLWAAVDQGTFREDLLHRINLWSFRLPGLAARPEDIEPNLHYELDAFTSLHGDRVRFNREALECFLAFALEPSSTWRGNFRDLNAAVTRMATLAALGRITVDLVEEEIQRLRSSWGHNKSTAAAEAPHRAALLRVLTPDAVDEMDLFDQTQLAATLQTCAQCESLSEAGRKLFAISRTKKRRVNDADRLRKYLARFNLSWADLS